MKTRINGHKLSRGGRADAATVDSFLSHTEYSSLCEEQGAIRKELADTNRQLAVRGGAKADLNQKKAVLIARWEEINSILSASERARRDIRAERYARLGATGIMDTIVSAKALIEQLQKKLGEAWTEEQRELGSALKALIGSHSPLLDMVSRTETEQAMSALKEQHMRELHTERAASQLAVSQLKSQIRDLQDRRGRAAVVLEALYNGRYEEIDDWRKARGVTHRIHLTAEDCKKIEDALKG